MMIASAFSLFHIWIMPVILRALFGAFALLLLAGCESSRFVADVTQFHELRKGAGPQTFVVAPRDQSRSDSLEFRSYAGSIAKELERHGFQQVTNEAGSELVVLVDYDVGPGEVRSYAQPVYGYYPDQVTHIRGIKRDGKRFSAHIYESGGFVPLGYTEVTETLYKRSLTLEMVDAAAWRQGRTEKRYEGRVTSDGPESEIAAVMPLMIQALFLQFPGVDGKTQTVVLEPES